MTTEPNKEQIPQLSRPKRPMGPLVEPCDAVPREARQGARQASGPVVAR